MTTAVTFGRLNIPHHGHVQLVQKMLEHRDFAHVYLSTARSNNCWDTRALLFRHLLRVAGVDLRRVKLLKAANPWEAVEKSSECGDSHPLVVLGEDQSELGNSLAAHFETRFVTNRRSQSSTAVRHLLTKGNYEVAQIYNKDRYSLRLVKLLRQEETRRERT